MDILCRLKCEIVKVDKVFVDNITQNEEDAQLIRVINDMAEIYGSRVCAEGVESIEQYELIKKCGVSTIQGYYFSRPLPLDAFCAEYIAAGIS